MNNKKLTIFLFLSGLITSNILPNETNRPIITKSDIAFAAGFGGFIGAMPPGCSQSFGRRAIEAEVLDDEKLAGSFAAMYGASSVLWGMAYSYGYSSLIESHPITATAVALGGAIDIGARAWVGMDVLFYERNKKEKK